MSRLTRDGTAEPVSRNQILRHARGQGNINFPCSADHEQDWQPYPVDPYSAICDDHTYIHTTPTKRFDFFPPPDWGVLTRSRCRQIFSLKTRYSHSGECTLLLVDIFAAL